MTRKITVAIFALAVLTVGLLGTVQRTERVASAAISGNSAVIVVAGEFPWQRGH
jgi:hypothetical protein